MTQDKCPVTPSGYWDQMRRARETWSVYGSEMVREAVIPLMIMSWYILAHIRS